jgi:2-polyprenyl-3-methyl-5-hydroxy-6-metoxy-1,4-benzoquinol methylase
MPLSGRIGARLTRAAAMDRAELRGRIIAKVRHAFGYRENVRRIAFQLDRYSRRLWDAPYREREAGGPSNLAVKLERLHAGGPFEPYDVSLINRAAITLLETRHARILEVGSGTGMFASRAALDPARVVVASEMDEGARAWAVANRPAPNITYTDRSLDTIADNEFDLVVAIEVIEHLAPFGPFLRALSRVAPEALISTPNKNGDPFQSLARTPPYSEHVREWTAGEFFWVLRAFYQTVELFTVPALPQQVAALMADEGYMPRVERCTDLSTDAALIARCSHPLLHHA